MARDISPPPSRIACPPLPLLHPNFPPPLKKDEPQKTTHFQGLRQWVYGTPHFALLAGDIGMGIARQVGSMLGKDVPSNPAPFANNESRVIVDPQLAATRDVYIIQAANNSPDTILRQVKNLELGAKSADANRITAIFTHLPYSRQDKIEQPGAPDAARNVIQEILDAGSHNYRKRRHQSKLRADARLLVVDAHAEHPFKIVERDSKLQWANLDSATVLAPRIREIIEASGLNAAIAFPDKGAAQRYSNYLHLFGQTPQQTAVIKKERPIDQNNIVKISDAQEDVREKVEGRDMFLIDDMIDTGGTILQAAKYLKQQGAKSVRLVATHGIFSGNALEKMSDDAIDGVVVTDSIVPTPEVLAHSKIEVVSLAPLIAETIRRIEMREPLTGLYKSMSDKFETSYRRPFNKTNRYRRKHNNWSN